MAKWEMEVTKYGVEVPDYILPLIPGYLERRAHEIQVLKDRLMVRDFESVRIIGHKLRGNGKGYGFERISQLGAEIEDAAESKNSLQLEALILDLEHELVDLTS